MNYMILHPQYESLQREIEGLKGDIVTLRTRLDHVRSVEEPLYLKKYNQYFGLLEHEISEKYYEYCLLKRKLEMITAALNRNATPDMETINSILEIEAREYREMLAQKKAELRETLEKNFCRVNFRDTEQTKMLYQKIVRALHPDLNPIASEEDCQVLQQAVEAFSAGDISTLEAIATVLDMSGRLNPTVTSGSMDELKNCCDHLIQTVKSLVSQLNKMDEKFPLNQRKLLQDKKLINKKMETLKKEHAHLEEVLQSFRNRIRPFETDGGESFFN